jgi:hypothetical protein
MNYKSRKLALTLTSTAFLASVGMQADGANPPQPDPTLHAATVATLNKAEIKKMLATIEQSKAPDPKMGACCYDMAAPPAKMEYVCPHCGTKTLYAKDVAYKWNRELDSCRRMFKELPKHETMVLDETSFCHKCRSGTNSPSLKLQIRFNDGTTNTVNSVSSSDFLLLKGLLSNKLDHPTLNAGTSDLKQDLPRLRELLGVKGK